MKKGDVMKIKKIAVCVLTLLTIGMGSSLTIKASENNNIDRTPRTNGVSPDFWTRMELGSIASHYAEAAGIPDTLVRAVVRVESDWDQSMTGLAGEIGLMQIKPETARDMGYIEKDEKLYDPDTNIRWGVRYLAEAWRLANGDICQTVLKYNSGHQAEKMTQAATEYCARVRNLMTSASII
jgi:soluble lytic murein transglycosylase-like protein